MTTVTSFVARRGLFLAIALLAGPAALAQDAKTPSADEIIARYVEATGGVAAYEKLKNRVMKGTVELPQMGKVPITLYYSAPDRSYLRLELGDIGTIERGCNGTLAWETNPMTGARVLTGEEADEARRGPRIDRWVKWKDLYAGVESVAETKVDDKAAWKVTLKTKAKGLESYSFDQATGLLLKQERTRRGGPDGQDVPLENRFQDYRKVDDVLIAHTARLRYAVAGQSIEQTTVWESVEHNVEIPKDRYDVPREVKDVHEQRPAGDDAPK